MGVVQEAYVKGVSTRKVDDLVQALGMTGISKSEVSRLCVELDEQVAAFLNRELTGSWPFLWLDATYLKAREGGRVMSKAVVVAVGVNAEGRGETLGLAVGPAETQAFWFEHLRQVSMQCGEPAGDDYSELHQQSADVIGQRRSLLHQQLTRALHRLQPLLLDALELCLLHVRATGRFGYGESIVLVRLMALAEGSNRARR